MSDLVKVSAAGAEPVDLGTAKGWLRVEFDEDNGLISALISAAREYAEIFCNRSFLATEQWSLALDRFPLAVLADQLYANELPFALWENEEAYLSARPERFAIEIPMGPVQSIVSLTYIDGNGVTQTLDPTLYFLVASDDGNPRIYPKFGTWWPVTQPQAAAIIITFNAGTLVVPQGVILAIQQLVAHWYTNREAVVMVSGVMPQNVPFAATALLWPHRILEL